MCEDKSGRGTVARVNKFFEPAAERMSPGDRAGRYCITCGRTHPGKCATAPISRGVLVESEETGGDDLKPIEFSLDGACPACGCRHPAMNCDEARQERAKFHGV